MQIWNKSSVLGCISFLGTGLITKKMPGTVGSFFASITLLFIPSWAIPYLFIVLLVIGLLGCSAFFKQQKKEGGIIDRDPGFIVIDEVCGIYCCGIFLMAVECISPTDFAISFALFRFFDILKPWPIKQIEGCLKNGKPLFRLSRKKVYRAQNRNIDDKLVVIGIMIDDILAAIYASLVHAVYIYLILR
ncbi:MAG: phosphatidylglycerophosphatase A [Holosporales bacterium]|jgi:phosphatidylglycerophosphatase A|nr:phosphatidylglycerophosphatase A [Holosporales bacterium]